MNGRWSPETLSHPSCQWKHTQRVSRKTCIVSLHYRTVFSTKKTRRVQSSTEFSVSWQYLRVPTYSNVPPMNSRPLRNGRRTNSLRVLNNYEFRRTLPLPGDHSDLWVRKGAIGKNWLCRFFVFAILRTCWLLLMSRILSQYDLILPVNNGNFCVFYMFSAMLKFRFTNILVAFSV